MNSVIAGKKDYHHIKTISFFEAQKTNNKSIEKGSIMHTGGKKNKNKNKNT